ncbi:MAG: complex I NDUFA9 subunit family protein [Rhodospirillaceae bacterium]|nr:complex I NDUFA9 subunit family protein [Rhodospirillaceae bacterium]
MADRLITVFGGSGFIGRYLVRLLAAQGCRVRVAVRDTERALFLKTAGDLGQIAFAPASVTDPAAVARAVDGADGVVNLVGILFERGARTFQAVHADGARNVAMAAAAAGATHLVHMSAFGADAHSPSAYARSKAAGEAAVKQAFPRATIMRPSVVFGPEDGFFNLFGRMAQISPVLPYFTDIVPHAEGGGGPRFQPVYVGDVAAAMAAALAGDGHVGVTYELVGPRVYDMRSVLEIVNRETLRKRWIAGMPFVAAEIQAVLADLFAKVVPLWPPLITPDQVKLLKLGNVGAGRKPGLAAFGIAPTTVEAIVPGYLKRFRPVQQNKRVRAATR